MKILFVSPYLPSPPRFGGQRRLSGLMRELSTRHEVSVLAFNKRDPWEQESIVETERYCREVRAITDHAPEESSQKRKQQLLSMLSRHSFEHLLVKDRRDFKAALEEMLRKTPYDVVQFEFAQMAPFRGAPEPGERPLFVLDEHNVEYDLLKRTAEAATGFARQAYNAFNWRKLAREERAAWRRFDGVTLTSRRDQELLWRDFPTCRSKVIPNGVDVGEFSRAEGSGDALSLLFFGAINYFPNAAGIIDFIDNVFPKIRERSPNVTFRVLGPGAGPEVLSRQGNGVEVLGMVDDVNPYIERAAAVVVPLHIGGGTRLKIVEALSKGKPVISTRLGAEGIDVVHGEHLLLADEPGDFADQVLRVLMDPAFAARLGDAGRQLMVDRYSWRHIVGQLEGFFEELQATRASTSQPSPG